MTARINRNADNPLWPGLEANWKAVCGQAEATLAEYRKGIPVARTARLAAQEVARLAQHLEPRSVVITALAVYLLQEADGRRFKSDEAFRFQLVRRVRGLTEANAGLWFDPTTGKRKRVYRELPPKAAAVLAEWIVAALAGVGVLIARIETEQREAKLKRVAAMAEGARALQ